MANKSNNSVNIKNIRQRAPKKKKKAGTTIIIATLSILLIGSVVAGVTGAFFGQNQTVTGDITLGDPVLIEIQQGGSTVSSLTFPGTALPGTSYTQPISVYSPANTSDAVLRATLTISNPEAAAYDVASVTDAAWNLHTDGYYYYDGILTTEATANFVSSLTVPKELTNADANKIFTVVVLVESIQHANGAASEVWTTAPPTWVTNFGSGT